MFQAAIISTVLASTVAIGGLGVNELFTLSRDVQNMQKTVMAEVQKGNVDMTTGASAAAIQKACVSASVVLALQGQKVVCDAKSGVVSF